MKATNFNIIRYDADENKLFDFAEPRYIEDENGNQVEEHLLVKTIFIGNLDSIDNYKEVEVE